MHGSLFHASLQPRHRREKLYSCKEHIGCDHLQRSRVMFSDKSHFIVTNDSGQQLLWRETWNTVCTKVCSWMSLVWPRRVGVSRHYAQRQNTASHLWASYRYIAEVLQREFSKLCSLFKGYDRSNSYPFIDDNTRPHRSVEVSTIQQREIINSMQCSAYSPDLNPIGACLECFFA